MKQAKMALALVVCLALLVPAVSAYASAGSAGASGVLLLDEGNENGCGAQTVWTTSDDLRRGAQSAKDGAEEVAKEKIGEAQSFAEQTVQSAVSFIQTTAKNAGNWIIGTINSIINSVMNTIFGKHGGAAQESGNAVKAAAVAAAKLAGEESILVAVIVASTLALTMAAALSKVALVPLYCHISDGKALDNPQRKKIYEMIKANPGIRISELAKIAGIGWGATVYHIMVLEKGDYIASSIGSRSAGLFENNGRYTNEERKAKALLSVGKSSLVFDYIRANPGSSSGAISGALGMSSPITSWYTQKLCEYGLIRKARNGKSVAHYPTSEASGVQCCGAARYAVDERVTSG